MGKKCVQTVNLQRITLGTVDCSTQSCYVKINSVCTNLNFHTVNPPFVHSLFSKVYILKTGVSTPFPQRLLLLLLICIQKHTDQSFLKKEFV